MRRLLLLLALIGLAGCAAGAPLPKPEDFPLHSHDQVFLLDYRIDRHPDRVEAVGLITSRSTTTFRFAAVNLYGVTADDRVVSRGSYVVNGSWGGPVSFTVTLTPDGKKRRTSSRSATTLSGLACDHIRLEPSGNAEGRRHGGRAAMDGKRDRARVRSNSERGR